MKNKLIFIILFFITSILSFSLEKVIIATGEWAPYSSEKMQGYGFMTEILTAAFKEINIEVEYKFYPWTRVILEIDKGRVFGGFPYFITPERKIKYDFSDVVVKSKASFFYKKSAGKIPEKFKWSKYEDLNNFIIGGTRGYWYEEEFKNSNLKVDYGVNVEEAFKKLYFNRVDLVPEDDLVGWQIIKKLYPAEIEDFETLDKPLKQDNLHLMISKKYPNYLELTKKFNKGLKKIKENGEYYKILKKYSIKETF